MAKTLLTIIIGFGIAFVGAVYVLPEWKTFTALRAKNAYLEQVSAELDELTQSRDALFAAVNSVSKEDLDRLNNTLPQGEDAARFLVAIGDMAKKNGLGLRQVDIAGTSLPREEKQEQSKPSQPRPGGSAASQPRKEVKELPFSLVLLGHYSEFKDFLQAIEKNARIIDAESISFNAASAKDAGSIEFSIKMKTYYQ